MKEVRVFTTSENPDFLVGPRKSWCFEEDQERFRRAGEGFMETMRQHFPEADYPYIALLMDVIAQNDTLCIIRPDLPSLGGQRGELKHWSKEYDASTPKGLAQMVHEEMNRPESPYQHIRPSSCVVSFIGEHKTLMEALKILKDEQGYEIKIINLE